MPHPLQCESLLFRYSKFQTMRLRVIEEAAESMGVSVSHAVLKRQSYLWTEMNFWLDVDVGPTTWDVLCSPIFFKILDEMIQLRKDIFWRDKPRSKNDVTPEMKDRAKAHPVTNLIQFNKGKALAFCHSDKTPSMTYYAKMNRASCFVCNKTFDPIDILMIRDGMKYHDAIRALQ